jgi:hypothetical protein
MAKVLKCFHLFNWYEIRIAQMNNVRALGHGQCCGLVVNLSPQPTQKLCAHKAATPPFPSYRSLVTSNLLSVFINLPILDIYIEVESHNMVPLCLAPFIWHHVLRSIDPRGSMGH